MTLLDPANPIAGNIPERLERLPLSRFHLRGLGVIGLAHLFDAFDSLIIAFVLPALLATWHITTLQAALLISIGFVGQLIGAIAISALAERIGRRAALRLSLFIVSILSLACSVAPTYLVLVGLRFVQGFGLGGEVPVAASYLNELCPARFRGRVVYILQAMFAAGTLVTAAVALQVIPRFGWHAMFLIGTLPLFLALLLPRLIPESPRWLAEHGRIDEAEQTVATIEADIVASGVVLGPVVPAPVPEATRGGGIRALFQYGYTTRTLSTWAIAFCLSITGYGLLTWMPTLYSSVYKLPLAKSLAYSLTVPAVGIFGALAGAIFIERFGRRRCFLVGFLGGAAPLLVLIVTLPSAFVVMMMAAVAMFFMTLLLSGIYVYAPEIYPTRIRALGTGVATAWMRIASIVGPLLVGGLLAAFGVRAVFALFSGAAIVGAIVVWLFAIETRGRSLEDIAR